MDGDDEGRRSKKIRSKNSCSSRFSDAVFACCCGGFLNPNGKGSKEYYEVLGVHRSSSLADIKKAYKKLSLAYHPDKLAQRGETLTDDMRDKFRKIKLAYEVLSDPERRKVYDSLGVNGLTLKEDPGSFFQDPSKMQELVAQADKRAWCVVLSITTLILSFVFLFPILFALEADGTIEITWAIVFLPLWIVYFLAIIALATGICI